MAGEIHLSYRHGVWGLPVFVGAGDPDHGADDRHTGDKGGDDEPGDELEVELR